MVKKVLVVVLGDLTRSPRMQYHCISLAENGYDVTVIANGGGPRGNQACEILKPFSHVHQQLMINDPIDFKSYLPTLFAYIVKVIWQTLLLLFHLMNVSIPHVIIVQNPPSLPTLPILYCYARLVRAKLLIDWHNYGYTLLRLNMKRDNLLVRIYKYLEFNTGRLADAHFCVSETMKKDLERRGIGPIQLLYDKPPNQFRPMTYQEKYEFLLKMQNESEEFKTKTIGWLTRSERPAIVMSSTSWTEDEDFGLLLRALKLYDERHDVNHLPNILCVITGKGPLKAYYESEIERLKLKHVRFVLPWLSVDDYPMMVGACDLGVSLHSSSSGLDLPMKVVDMLGCATPVLAYDFRAIHELVVHGIHGRTFSDSTELYKHLCNLLSGFGFTIRHTDSSVELALYSTNIVKKFLGRDSRWSEYWTKRAKPVIDALAEN